jgi:hypothetical protein
MKYIIILTTLLLLNCADNITKNYSTRSNTQSKAWCSIDKYNNGEPKQMYVLEPIESYNGGTPEYFGVTVDSSRGDSIFINTTDGQKVIVENPYGTIDELLEVNSFYEMDTAFDRYSEMYYKVEDLERCIE